MAANQAYLLPAVVDWTSGARAKLLASVSQVCNLAIRHCRRHASKAVSRGAASRICKQAFLVASVLQCDTGPVLLYPLTAPALRVKCSDSAFRRASWQSLASSLSLMLSNLLCMPAVETAPKHSASHSICGHSPAGGKGKLAATKELNTSGAAGSAANQQWRGQRAIAGLAADTPKPSHLFQLPTPFGPPFAALPFLNSQVRPPTHLCCATRSRCCWGVVKTKDWPANSWQRLQGHAHDVARALKSLSAGGCGAQG